LVGLWFVGGGGSVGVGGFLCFVFVVFGALPCDDVGLPP